MMAEELSQKKCTPCSGDSSPVTKEEMEQLKTQVPDWNIKNEDGEMHLERVYEFPNFKQALEFTKQVGETAEEEGHHPVLQTEWGKVTVTWWTHAINGLHENDFVMASKSDRIAKKLAHA